MSSVVRLIASTFCLFFKDRVLLDGVMETLEVIDL